MTNEQQTPADHHREQQNAHDDSPAYCWGALRDRHSKCAGQNHRKNSQHPV